jgi:hypothetical protein
VLSQLPTQIVSPAAHLSVQPRSAKQSPEHALSSPQQFVWIQDGHVASPMTSESAVPHDVIVVLASFPVPVFVSPPPAFPPAPDGVIEHGKAGVGTQSPSGGGILVDSDEQAARYVDSATNVARNVLMPSIISAKGAGAGQGRRGSARVTHSVLRCGRDRRGDAPFDRAREREQGIFEKGR